MLSNETRGSKAQVALFDIMARAAADGWKVGRSRLGFLRHCPYTQHDLVLREAWLGGFVEGRVAGAMTAHAWQWRKGE